MYRITSRFDSTFFAIFFYSAVPFKAASIKKYFKKRSFEAHGKKTTFFGFSLTVTINSYFSYYYDWWLFEFCLNKDHVVFWVQIYKYNIKKTVFYEMLQNIRYRDIITFILLITDLLVVILWKNILHICFFVKLSNILLFFQTTKLRLWRLERQRKCLVWQKRYLQVT